MNQTAMYILWAAAIVIFGVVEALTVQLVSIWFVCGAIGAFIASLCGANLLTQVLIFVGITILALIFTRPLVKKRLKPKVQSTNADRCIGKEAVVTQRIDNLSATGQVNVAGSIWTARSAEDVVIEEGTTVKVVRIEGVKVIVTTIKEYKE